MVVEEYWQNGELHNERGPAIQEWDVRGRLINTEYWLYGKQVVSLSSCADKIIEVDGKKFKLTPVSE